MNTIDAVMDAYINRRYDNFKIASIQRQVERIQKRPVPASTVKRALRQLRDEGFVGYTYNNKTNTYVVSF